jgi:hypothetical protein
LQTTYRFEDSTDGVHWTSLGQANAAEGTSGQPVTQTAGELTANTTYHVRLVAHSTAGTSISSEEMFTTLAGPPEISGTAATDIGATEATLHATIHPEGQPSATYRFEYGPTTSYGTSVPFGEGIVGSTPTQVTQQITGLAPGTTYHFRVVASNDVGSPTTTADQAFTTYPSTQAAGGCPNEQLRKESDVNPTTGVPFSQQLPECRAYEMVSPPLKNGAPISSEEKDDNGSWVAVLGSEGSTVLIGSFGIWPGAEQPANNDVEESLVSEGDKYRVTRGSSGWVFKPEVPPASQLRVFNSFAVPNSADMSPNGLWEGAGFAPEEQSIGGGGAAGAITVDPNFYLLEPNGGVAEIGPSVPTSVRREMIDNVEPARLSNSSQAASTDLSHMLFSLEGYFRWAFDETKFDSDLTRIVLGNYNIQSLYEYIGTGHTGEGADVPTLVGVDNTGALISQCGTNLAGYNKNGEQREEPFDEPEARVISGGGSTVFFTSLAAGESCNVSSSDGPGTGPAVDQLFARVGEPGPGTDVGEAVTFNVAGSTECDTAPFDSCNVTQAPVYQGASTDGSKVFFTSGQPLVAGDTDSTNNLYQCRLPGDSGKPLTLVAPVNSCPELVRVSLPLSGAAEVQSVAAVSADGSHVYFIAKGVLSGANAEHNSPTAGHDNLYVWDEGRTAFIATLPSAAFKLGEEQATPDGEQLVFTSSADLTPDDTSTVAQVFLYEAQRETLTRISRGQGGYNDDGNTTTNPASIRNAAAVAGRRVISEDGSAVVFESNEALTSQVHGGTRNVYLWRDGNVYLISDGTPAGEHSGNGYAGLVGIDASGQNIFFATEAQLVGQDTDELSDLYDARVGGGFPAPKVNGCAGEACQGASSAPPAPVSPGSLSSGGAGNLPPPVGSTTSAKPTVEILKTEVKAAMLLVTVKTSAKGRVQITGEGLTITIEKAVGAGTHQIEVKLTKAGRKARAHRKKIELRASLTVGKQSVANTTSVKL